MIQTNFENFLKHTRLLKKAWQGHANFLFKKYCRKKVGYFGMVPFALSRQ